MTTHNIMCPHLIGSPRLYRLTPGKYTVYIVTSLWTFEKTAHPRKQNILMFFFSMFIFYFQFLRILNSCQQLKVLKSFDFFSSYSKDLTLEKILSFFYPRIIFYPTKHSFFLAQRHIDRSFCSVLERRIFFHTIFFSSADN